jgi:GT2 family glycosyltransferase
MFIPTSVTQPISIAVLMTCFNRREQTLKCLEALFSQQGLEAYALKVFLVDDGSTDGTSQAVRDRFASVEVIRGSGNLYWNQGMRVAFARALETSFAYYLWLNDDTLLLPTAFQILHEASAGLASKGITAIVTGSTCDASNGEVSYGGQRWQNGWKRRLALVRPHPDQPLPCDTMNGNCTLIPHTIAHVLGNLDSGFQHSFGDFDYGFRAQSAGFAVYVASGFAGHCSDNTRLGTWRDSSKTLRKRWKHLTSPKGSPFGEWSLYCRRHLGALWPLYAVSPYVKTIASSCTGFLAR